MSAKSTRSILSLFVVTVLFTVFFSLCAFASTQYITITPVKKNKTYKVNITVKNKLQIKLNKSKAKSIKYKSSKTKIATVNKKGLVTTKKTGNTNIAVSYKIGKKKYKITIKLTVKKATNSNSTNSNGNSQNNSSYNNSTNNNTNTTPKVPLTGVVWSDTNTNTRNAQTLTVGKTATLSAKPVPANTTDSTTITWSSSNTSVATVSNGTVTAKQAGTATISAKIGSYKTTAIFNCVEEKEWQIFNRDNGRMITLTHLKGAVDTSKLQIIINNGNCTKLYPNGQSQSPYIQTHQNSAVCGDTLIVPNWNNAIAEYTWCYKAASGMYTIFIECTSIFKSNWTIPIKVYYNNKLIYSTTAGYTEDIAKYTQTNNLRNAYYYRQRTNEIKQLAFAKYPHSTPAERIQAVGRYLTHITGYDNIGCIVFSAILTYAIRDEGYYAGFVYQIWPTITDWRCVPGTDCHTYVRYLNPTTNQFIDLDRGSFQYLGP